MRELSLRGLRNVGGEQATAALVSLLKDPEPNVRAAVLKQLSEDAPGDMVDAIAEYGADAGVLIDGVLLKDATVRIGSTQVVGSQGTVVADASGGGVIDAEARTALNAWLARARTHGLIAT